MKEKERFFKFDSRDVKSILTYELKLMWRMQDSFQFIFERLVELGHHQEIKKVEGFDLESIPHREGKNYHYIAVTYKNIKLLLRKYGAHITVFVQVQTKYQKQYGAFTFHTDTTGLDGKLHDSYCDYPLTELNKGLPRLMELLQEDKIHGLWNNYTFPVPDYCEVKVAFVHEEVYSFDLTVFCAEELSNLHLELFSEGKMLEKLKTMSDRVGQPLDSQYIIKEIKTDFPEQYDDPYYHGVGIACADKRTSEKKWIDVYSLTMWYLDDVFKDEDEKNATNVAKKE